MNLCFGVTKSAVIFAIAGAIGSASLAFAQTTSSPTSCAVAEDNRPGKA